MLGLVALRNESVLAAGGWMGSPGAHALRSTEIWSPWYNNWTVLGNMTVPRAGHGMVHHNAFRHGFAPFASAALASAGATAPQLEMLKM